MRFLQFPWRWLVALQAPMSIFFAAAVWTGKPRRQRVIVAACAIFFVSVTAVADVSLFQECDDEDSVLGMLDVYHSGTGFVGTDEYAPPGADNALVATNLPGACLVSNPGQTLGQGDPDMTPDWSPDQHSCEATYELAPIPGKPPVEHMQMHAEVPHDGYLVLHLRTYPAWTVHVNGRPAIFGPARADGMMVVAVPTGPVHLTIDWTTTRDMVVGRWISLAALLMITALATWHYRRVRPRLS
jgi:hypothetical protein